MLQNFGEIRHSGDARLVGSVLPGPGSAAITLLTAPTEAELPQERVTRIRKKHPLPGTPSAPASQTCPEPPAQPPHPVALPELQVSEGIKLMTLSLTNGLPVLMVTSGRWLLYEQLRGGASHHPRTFRWTVPPEHHPHPYLVGLADTYALSAARAMAQG